MSGPVDVVVVGETMGSLRGQGPLRLGGSMDVTVAGAESNVAIGLARLGHTTRWVGRVGDDEVGRLVLRTLRAEGVDLTSARTVTGVQTGLMLLEHRTADHVRVTYHRRGSAGAGLARTDLDDALAAGARVLHVSGVTAALSAGACDAVRSGVERARAAGWLVSLDVNHRQLLWQAEEAAKALRPLLPLVSILVASEAELAIVTDEVDDPVSALLDAGPTEVVVTRGAGGADVALGDSRWTRTAIPANVVDPVGAGDAFVSGYLSGLLDGADPEKRLERGVQVAAFAVASRGDWEGLPSRAELGVAAAEQDGVWR